MRCNDSGQPAIFLLLALYGDETREEKTSPEFEFIYFLFPFLPVRETLRDCPCFGGGGRKEKREGRAGEWAEPFPPLLSLLSSASLSLSFSLVSSEGRERERERAAAALGDFRAVDSGATWCQNRTFLGTHVWQKPRKITGFFWQHTVYQNTLTWKLKEET